MYKLTITQRSMEKTESGLEYEAKDEVVFTFKYMVDITYLIEQFGKGNPSKTTTYTIDVIRHGEVEA